jgi:hypothetical protein
MCLRIPFTYSQDVHRKSPVLVSFFPLWLVFGRGYQISSLSLSLLLSLMRLAVVFGRRRRICKDRLLVCDVIGCCTKSKADLMNMQSRL